MQHKSTPPIKSSGINKNKSLDLIDFFIKVDERLNELIIAAKDGDWDIIVDANSWAQQLQFDIGNIPEFGKEPKHADISRLLKRALDKNTVLVALISERIVKLSSLVANNAVEIKLAKAYGG